MQVATTHERRSLMYSYSPKHMATHDDGGAFYAHVPAPWLAELTPVQVSISWPTGVPHAVGLMGSPSLGNLCGIGF